MPRVALIVFHANTSNLYPDAWITQFTESIVSQSYREFDIVECNYGDDNRNLFGSNFYQKLKLNNHAEALNLLLDHCLIIYDYVLATNVDDYYHPDYVKCTVEALEQGYDIVSCNFSLIDEKGILTNQHRFHHRDIKFELSRDHNIIAHPAVGYSKNFWEGNRYDPNEIPYEDLKLWQRSIDKYKFHILAENLLYHRVHSKAVSFKPLRA